MLAPAGSHRQADRRSWGGRTSTPGATWAIMLRRAVARVTGAGGHVKQDKKLTRQAGGRASVASTVLLLALYACDSSSTRSLPEALLGQWYYDGSSGGIDGGRKGDIASGYIVIGRDNTLETYDDDGSLVSRTAFTAVAAETIFSTEDLWMIQPQQGEPEVAILSDDGLTLSLSPNAYDAIGRTYVRTRSTGR